MEHRIGADRGAQGRAPRSDDPPPIRLHEGLGGPDASPPESPLAIELLRRSPPPPPRQRDCAAPMLKPSLVAPIEVGSTALLEHLDALAHLVDDEAALAIARTVCLSYQRGALHICGHDAHSTAIVEIPAAGGPGAFQCVVALRRLHGVVRLLETSFARLTIGLDGAHLHVGRYSIPHAAAPSEFPAPPPGPTSELAVTLPAKALRSILEKLVPLLDAPDPVGAAPGVHLDFGDGSAVMRCRSRLHRIALGDVQMLSRSPYARRPAVTLPGNLLRFLGAVGKRETFPIQVSDGAIATGDDEYAVIARPLEQVYVPWRESVPKRAGHWVVDKEAFGAALAELLQREPKALLLVGDPARNLVMLETRGGFARRMQKVMPGTPYNARPASYAYLDPQHLGEAVAGVDTPALRLGFDDPNQRVTITDQFDDFLAVLDPIKP